MVRKTLQSEKDGKQKRERLPTKEELLIWQAATSQDEKLAGAKIDWDKIEENIPAASPSRIHLRPSLEKLSELTGLTAASINPSSPALLPHSGIDRNSARRLRQGKLAVEATLDLHGMGRETARIALEEFIDASYARNIRVLLVITGKGRFSSEEGGILRQLLPKWLTIPPCENKILSFSAARQKDGGAGAFYILLRRKRFTVERN